MKLHSAELRSPNSCFFMSIKLNARNIIFNQRPIVINEINSDSRKNCKKYYNQYNIINTNSAGIIFIIIFIFNAIQFNSTVVILANFTCSIVSVHSLINLSTNFFLHLQFS